MPGLIPTSVLYTRKQCHLCEVALRQLADHGLSPEIVDIDQYPELVERFNECVPVVVIDGRERFRGRVNETLLKRELAGARPGYQVLGMFAKFWEPGRVKTRLAAAVGPDAAARIYHQFVATLVTELTSMTDQRWLLYDPPERRVEFERLAAGQWHVVAQSPGDLGQRMAHFFAQAVAVGSQRTVLIGSDSPNLPPALIEQAFDRLRHDRVVVGPTDDGGYYLIGIAGPAPSIFEHVAWSTPQVWEQTERQLQRLGIGYATLPTWYDVDEREDLKRLERELCDPSSDKPAYCRLQAAIRTAVGDEFGRS